MRNCRYCQKKFKPLRDEQEVCSEECLVKEWEKLPGKTRTKLKARGYARQLGYRSMSEVKYAILLRTQGIKATYETTTVRYQLPTQKYTPDFVVGGTTRQGPIYLEYKGVFSGADRKKLRYVRRSNPDMDIRLVFERSNNKLNRYSKTTYGQWADNNGFIWYDANDVATLAKDIKKHERKASKTTGGNS